ncbi:MAG TPA: YafY family protein [Ktedonobacteraceae bacterium]|jgi:predicted DNA-binding transcriptional regulator YafY|nr:YafY family protein [Ktedonobacteraceae bacterium]
MQKTERLVAISLLLQARGKMSAQHLATMLGVSVRTVYRDIVALSLAHVPISMDYGPGGGYYLPDDYHFESAIFTSAEAVSLVLSIDIAGNYSLFAGDDDLHRALFKLEAALPEEYRTNVKIARERFFFDGVAWYRTNNDTPPYLETLRTAVLGAHHVDILYPYLTDNGDASSLWRHVEPYGLVFKGLTRRHMRTGIWYLVAYCHECQSFSTFRVSYIESLQIRDETITFDPDFNLRTYWKEARKHLAYASQAFTMKLRVAPSVRHVLRGSYTIEEEEPDGHLIISVEVDSFDDAVSYVLGLGAGATVICPRKVRQAVATTAYTIAAMYEQ